jgi:hypothetical protein
MAVKAQCAVHVADANIEQSVLWREGQSCWKRRCIFGPLRSAACFPKTRYRVSRSTLPTDFPGQTAVIVHEATAAVKSHFVISWIGRRGRVLWSRSLPARACRLHFETHGQAWPLS